MRLRTTSLLNPADTATRAALIDDFIALEFLPPNADRGLIVPVMERVLGPYLRGGGARSFNFQALSQVRAAARRRPGGADCGITALTAGAVHPGSWGAGMEHGAAQKQPAPTPSTDRAAA